MMDRMPYTRAFACASSLLPTCTVSGQGYISLPLSSSCITSDAAMDHRAYWLNSHDRVPSMCSA